jgi:hypothetical protein
MYCQNKGISRSAGPKRFFGTVFYKLFVPLGLKTESLFVIRTLETWTLENDDSHESPAGDYSDIAISNLMAGSLIFGAGRSENQKPQTARQMQLSKTVRLEPLSTDRGRLRLRETLELNAHPHRLVRISLNV